MFWKKKKSLVAQGDSCSVDKLVGWWPDFNPWDLLDGRKGQTLGLCTCAVACEHVNFLPTPTPHCTQKKKMSYSPAFMSCFLLLPSVFKLWMSWLKEYSTVTWQWCKWNFSGPLWGWTHRCVQASLAGWWGGQEDTWVLSLEWWHIWEL